jgi:hypothetical protein
MESRDWRAISPCDVPAPRISGSTPRPETSISRFTNSRTDSGFTQAGVPGPPPELRPAERAGYREIDLDGVLHVEEVALGVSVGANQRALAPHERPSTDLVLVQDP